MEDSFKLRVDKIFGSLSSSSSASSSSLSSSPALSSLWSLTDDEIEKREWDRDKGSPEPESTPYPSNLDGFFSNQQELQHQQRRQTAVSVDKSLKFSAEIEEDLEDLDDEVDDDADVVSGSSKQPAKPDDHDDEEWQIRSSIGLDPTLDYEDEEDEFDKVAVGRDNDAGDRVYMSKLNDYGTCSNSYNELPISFNEAVRDSRANLMAAKLRLKQDAEAAGSFDSLTVYDKSQGSVTGAQSNTDTDVSNLKSILKRKENPSESKLQKRVRFDSECKNDFQEEFEKADEVAKETCPMEEGQVSNEASLVVPQDHNPSVPDYLRNPSKYTCYTFDDSSTEVDEESNRRAYMDFLNLVRKSNPMEAQPDDASVDLPKSVTFTPRKKTGDSTAAKNSTDYNPNEEDGKGPAQRKGFPVTIAAVEVEGSEACDMDEDEPETVAENGNSSRKSGRQYRSKVRSELDHIP